MTRRRVTRRRERRERIKYNRQRRATRVYSHSPTPPQWDALGRGVKFYRFGVAHLHIRLGRVPIEVPCEHAQVALGDVVPGHTVVIGDAMMLVTSV